MKVIGQLYRKIEKFLNPHFSIRYAIFKFLGVYILNGNVDWTIYPF